MAVAMAVSMTKPVRCAIYTRKSTEHGLELEFNSLDAQRDACEAYIKNQASQASRWAWRELNSCSKPCSVDLRV